MSREEAAVIYLDNLLGSHQNYKLYQKADSTLTQNDKELLRQAVSCKMREIVAIQESSFFVSET